LPLSHALFQTGRRRAKGNAGDRPMMSNCIRSVAPVMTTPAEKGLSLLDTPGIISSEPINRDHWASLLRAHGDLVRKMRRLDWDPCPSCLKTIDERGGQEWRKTVPRTILSDRDLKTFECRRRCTALVSRCMSLRPFCLDRACFARPRRQRAGNRRGSKAERPRNDEKRRETGGNEGKRRDCSGGRSDLGQAAGHTDHLRDTCLQFRIC